MSGKVVLSDQDWLLLVYATYGKTMLQAHSLELTLKTLLIFHLETYSERHVSINDSIVKLNRMTLGMLIDEFLKRFSPNEELAEELDNLLFYRNLLTHRISDFIINKAINPNLYETVINELEEIRGYFIEVKPLLEPYMSAARSKLGVSKEQLLEMAQTFNSARLAKSE